MMQMKNLTYLNKMTVIAKKINLCVDIVQSLFDFREHNENNMFMFSSFYGILKSGGYFQM